MKIKIRKIRKNEAGVSEVIGTVFMLTITIAIFSTIFLVFNDQTANVLNMNKAQNEANERFIEYLNNWKPGTGSGLGSYSNPSGSPSDGYPDNKPPVITVVSPINNSVVAMSSQPPTICVNVSDMDGDAISVKLHWYKGLDAEWVQDDNVFFVKSNSTIEVKYPYADTLGTRYYWTATAFDGTTVTTSEPMSFVTVPP